MRTQTTAKKAVFQCKFDVIVELFVRTQTTAKKAVFQRKFDVIMELFVRTQTTAELHDKTEKKKV